MIVCPKLSQDQIVELMDVVKHSKNALNIKRAQAVLMVNSQGYLPLITELTNFKRSRVFGIRKLYLDKGLPAITSRSKSNKELLTKSQVKELLETVKNSKPFEMDPYYENQPFWTTSVLADYVLKKYDVKYKSKTSYHILFKKINFTFHKPGRVYIKQDPIEIASWLEQTKPVLEQALKDPNTVILCEDESLISTQTTNQKIWLEANTYPRIEVNTKRENKSIYGFLNIKTGREHAFTANYQTMYETERILKKIRLSYPKNNNKGNHLQGAKILLFWDSAGWHKGSKVQEYIKRDGNITQVFFPRYTPELNPQEHVWGSAKEKIIKNKYIPDIEKTAKDFVSYLNSNRFNYEFLKHKV